jgi:hypothetical protein
VEVGRTTTPGFSVRPISDLLLERNVLLIIRVEDSLFRNILGEMDVSSLSLSPSRSDQADVAV